VFLQLPAVAAAALVGTYGSLLSSFFVMRDF